MSIHIDINGQLHDSGTGLALNCPHCQVLAHLTPMSTPLWSTLRSYKPEHIGVVYRCDACNAPVFIKYPVKFYAEQRIELGTQFVELERPREKFNFAHLPASCEVLFKEALHCYSQGTFNAFASMCRRTAQAMFKDMGQSSDQGGRMRVYDLLVEIRELVGLDKDSFQLVTRIVLERDNDIDSLPGIDARQAGMLLEIMKDLLYQCYIRRGKLQQALSMRRFFAEERASNVTPIKAMP
jgi:hypothetical protein